MNLQEMIQLYRAQADDAEPDPLCRDPILTIYANEAQEEACRRAQLLRDSTSPMCKVAFAAGDESVALAPQVVRVLRAFVAGQPAEVLNVEEMDCIMPGWQFQERQDVPQRLITGMTTGRLHLWPTPAAAGEIRLTVQRLPLKPLRCDIDKPEIRPELHKALVEWMLYRAYSTQDTELYNDAKAAVCLRRFEEEFGRKASGRNEEWVRSRELAVPGPLA